MEVFLQQLRIEVRQKNFCYVVAIPDLKLNC